MGVSLQLENSSWEVENNQVTMNKFVAYACLAATATYAAPSADAWGGYALAPALAPAVATITQPKCTLTFEEIETQNCIPKAENVCDTVDVEQESVTFEKECKDVTSKVCGPAAGAIPIIKREAEAEPWLGLAGHAVGAPSVAHHGLAPL